MASNDYSDQITAAEQRFGLPAGMLAALIQTESSGNPNATSPVGAKGLTQLMPPTAAGVGVTNAYDPSQAIQGGAKVLSDDLRASGGDVIKALKMYHGGTDTAQWGPKTQAYPGKVLANMPTAPAQSVDDIDAMFGTPAAAPSAPAVSASTAQPQKVEDVDAMFSPQASSADQPSSSWADYLKNQFGLVVGQYKEAGNKILDANNKAGAGIEAGIKSVIDKPAEWLINQETKAGIPQAAQNALQKLGVSPETASTLFPTGQVSSPNGQPSAQAQDQALMNQLTQYGDGSPQFELGKIGGQAAITAPLLSAGSAAVGGGLKALASGASELSPAIANAIQGVGNFVNGTSGADATGLGGVAQRMASRATAGAANGAAFNALTGQPVNVGAAIGGSLGGAASPLADAAQATAQKIVPMLDPETRALVQKAENLGIQLRAPQISDAPFVHYADSTLRTLPAMGYGDTDAALRGQFNGALAKQMGQDATKITPQVMSNAKTALGKQYDAIAPQLSIKASDDSFLSRLAEIQKDAQLNLTEQEMGPINRQIDNVLNGFQDGQDMNGQYAHNLIKKGAPLDRAMNNSSPNVAYVAGDIRQALNDAMQRNAPPEVADALAQTNAQYKAMKTIEPLVAKSPTGDISPALLMSQVNKSYGGMAYNGGGDMGDLARIGQKFLKEPPQSGTAPRSFIMNALATAGPAMVAMSPEAGISHLASGAMLAGTVAAGRGLKQIINSPAYYNALMGREGEPVTNWLLQR